MDRLTIRLNKALQSTLRRGLVKTAKGRISREKGTGIDAMFEDGKIVPVLWLIPTEPDTYNELGKLAREKPKVVPTYQLTKASQYFKAGKPGEALGTLKGALKYVGGNRGIYSKEEVTKLYSAIERRAIRYTHGLLRDVGKKPNLKLKMKLLKLAEEFRDMAETCKDKLSKIK